MANYLQPYNALSELFIHTGKPSLTLMVPPSASEYIPQIIEIMDSLGAEKVWGKTVGVITATFKILSKIIFH